MADPKRKGGFAGPANRLECLRGKRVLAVGAVLLVIAIVLWWLAYEGGSGVRDTTLGNAQREGRTDRDGTVDIVSTAVWADDALWREADERTVAPLPAYPEEWSVLGRALVDVSDAAAAAHGWQTGDRLVIPVPQLEEVYVAMIEEIDDGPGLARAAVASVRNNGRNRRVVVTVGPAHTFAYIETPRGSYELSAGREFGWLLPTSSMEAGFDFSKTDVIPRAAGNPERDRP